MEVDDRIKLAVSSDGAAVQLAVKSFGDMITQETLATTLSNDHASTPLEVTIEGATVSISLAKA